MGAAFEDGGSADLIGGAGGGNDQLDVAVAVVNDLGDAVMQEADADDALAGAHILGGAGAGLGVNLNVLVQFNQVLDAFVVTVLLDHGVDDQLGGAGGVVVGQPDQAFVLGLGQVGPVSGLLQTQALQLVNIDHEAQDALVDAVPVAVSITVCLAQQVGSVLSLVGHQQAFSGADVVGIGGAAEPDVTGGIAGFFLDLGLDFAGGQTLILHFDAVQLLELLTGHCQVLFLAGTVDNQGALSLSILNQLLHVAQLHGSLSFAGLLVNFGSLGLNGLLAAAGSQRQNHNQGKNDRK